MGAGEGEEGVCEGLESWYGKARRARGGDYRSCAADGFTHFTRTTDASADAREGTDEKPFSVSAGMQE